MTITKMKGPDCAVKPNSIDNTVLNKLSLNIYEYKHLPCRISTKFYAKTLFLDDSPLKESNKATTRSLDW